jgi:hypothetical protein
MNAAPGRASEVFMAGTNYVEIHGRRAGVDNVSGRIFAAGVPFTFTMTPAQGAANVCEVTVQAVDYFGHALAQVTNFDLWLSDAATGAGLTALTASGAVAAKAASGTDLVVYTAKKALRVQTDATGKYILSITDTVKNLFKVCAAIPDSGTTVVGATLTAGNYG